MNNSLKKFFFSVILISHLVFFAYWLYFFLKEIRANVKKKLPKLYFALFLCYKSELLD